MQPSTIQPLGHTVPCSTIITGSNTPSASSATSLIPGCLMQTPGTLTPLGMINNPHMGLIMQQNHQQQQQQQQQLMAQEQQQHQPNSMIPMTDPSFPVTSTPPIPVSTTARMSGFDSGGGSSGIVAVSQTFTPINNPSLVSLFGKPPKPRTESFAFDEVKILLQEIELRKHVLLSISHSMNRYKRRAWEEVAASMATRCPYGPRRTADQVKKKWENLVSKTKQKLRSGRITAESDWSDVNTAVLEFLAHHNPFLRMRYATAAASILSSNNDDDGKHAKETATITTDFVGLTRMYDSQMQSLGLPGLGGPLGLDHQLQQQQPQNSVIMIKEEVRSVSSAEMNADEEPIDSLQALETKSSANGGDVHNADNRPSNLFANFNGCTGNPGMSANSSSLLTGFPFGQPPVTNQLMGLPDAVGGPKLVCNLGPEHNRLLVDQLTKEHSARMELLQLQKRAWQLQVDLLQRSLSTDESGES